MAISSTTRLIPAMSSSCTKPLRALPLRYSPTRPGISSHRLLQQALAPHKHTRQQTTATPTATHQPARPDLLTRNPNRPLPSLAEVSPTRRWLRTFPLFAIILTVSALGIFNYQKVNSPIIAATLYSLRTNPVVRQQLGDEVYFASRWAWVYGSINLVQGKVDVRFYVKGTRGTGLCRFRAIRIGGKNGEFKTQEWSLKVEETGAVIQLLEDQGRDPMEAVAM